MDFSAQFDDLQKRVVEAKVLQQDVDLRRRRSRLTRSTQDGLELVARRGEQPVARPTA